MIRCGVIGMGKVGRTRVREILAHPELELVCYYDIQKVEGIHEGKSCESVEALLAEEIDAVFICTFNNVASPLTAQALYSGKHVFCEKPPARSSEELMQAINAEKETDLILKYGFNHRYHHSIIEAKKLLDSGMFGKMLWMRGAYGKAGGNYFTGNWRNDKELSGGGILLDQGIHMLDLMTFFAGDFHDVQSLIQTRFWEVPVEDNAFVIMKNKDDVAATLHSSATQWRHKFSLEMSFEGGYINLDGILSSTRSYGDETLVVAKRQFEDNTFAFGKPREEKIYFDTDDSWKLEVDEFVQCIKKNKPVENGTSSDALRVMKLIENIYANSRH